MLRRILSVIMLLIAAGCGGGGGGSNAKFSLDFNPKRIESVYWVGSEPVTEVFATVKDFSVFGGALNVFVQLKEPSGVVKFVTVIDQIYSPEYYFSIQPIGRLPEGTYSGNIEVSACYDAACTQKFPGSPAILPYKFTVINPVSLTVSSHALGLSSTPQGQVLERMVKIKELGGRAVGWTASANVPWLTVTASGTANDSAGLQVVANPSGLPDEQVSYGTVTVTPTNLAARPIQIQVGLWKSHQSTELERHLEISAYASYAQDPLRPYLYAAKVGGVDVFNIYTGSVVATISTSATDLGRMAVSMDGQRLYVLDMNGSKYMTLGLNSLQEESVHVLPEPVGYAVVAAMPIDQTEILMLSNGNFYRAADAKFLLSWLGGGSSGPGERNRFAMDPSKSEIYLLQPNGNGALVRGPALLRYSELGEGYLGYWGFEWTLGLTPSYDGYSIVFDGPRDRLLSAGGSCEALSTTYGLSTDETYFHYIGGEASNNVALTPDGRVLCATQIYSGGYPNEVRSVNLSVYPSLEGPYDSNKILYYRLYGTGSLQNGNFFVTPDGMFAVAVREGDYVDGRMSSNWLNLIRLP